MKTYTKVIVQRGEPLTETDISLALKVSRNTTWWRAIEQLIETSRQDYIERTSSGVDRNNPLSVARDIGGHESLTSLLIKLDELSLKGGE